MPDVGPGLDAPGSALVLACLLLASGAVALLLVRAAVSGTVRGGAAVARLGHAIADRLRLLGAGRLAGAVVGLTATASPLATASPAGAVTLPSDAGAPARTAADSAPPGAHLAPHVGSSVVAAVRARVVVAPGDSLWSLAAEQLGPGARESDVAAAWPQWYRLNRDAIGPDPSLLHPGLRLRVPEGRRPGTSTAPHHRPSPAPAPARVSAQSLDPDRR
jgi:nucleoid-associated protein YgaU